jgi:D-cysteine desulfhydrase
MSQDHTLAQRRRYPLGFFPTPVVEMRRLSTELGGPRLFIKRDDQTGLALGATKLASSSIWLARPSPKAATPW